MHGVTLFITQLYVESSLFGIYLVLFAAVIYLKTRNRRRIVVSARRSIPFVLLGLFAQFLTISGHWIDTIYVAYYSLIYLGGGQTAAAYYNNPSTPPLFAQLAMYTVCSIITDWLVIHRLFMVCRRKWIYVVLPGALLLGQVISGTGGLIVLGVLQDQGIPLLTVDAHSRGWVTTALLLSIIISTYSTAVIAWKIWRIHRALKSANSIIPTGTQLMPFFTIIIESAGLQTATGITILFAFLFGNVAQVLVLEIAPVIFGLSTVLIHARIGLGWAHEPKPDAQPGSGESSTPTTNIFPGAGIAPFLFSEDPAVV